MKAVSEIIAIILILMITIAIAGIAYTFMSTTMASTTAAASSAIDTTTTGMATSFVIDSIDVAKVYVRNTGQTAISDLSAYINDMPAHYNFAQSQITPGQVGTITIYDFIEEGDTIKVISSNGLSASKTASDPCLTAVGCWHFDEGYGAVAHDDSPHMKDGTLTNGPSWTTGMYGSGLLLDGANDYVNISNSANLSNNSNSITLSAWIKPNNIASSIGRIIGKLSVPYYGYALIQSSNDLLFQLYAGGSLIELHADNVVTTDWQFVTAVFDGSYVYIYRNGVQISNASKSGTINSGPNTIRLGSEYSNTQYFNGTIDEVRIYNRAIY
jgi:hypothetical protein